MHYNIERFFNDMASSPDCAEMPIFRKFHKEIMQKMDIEPYRTEWRICDPEFELAGSVDFVGELPDGTFVIMDWKRSKNLANSLDSHFGRRAKWPLEHIDDTDASKYFLQLNIYRYILQKHYDIQVSRMVLASFHPSTDEYFQVPVPLWEAEVTAALRHFAGRKDVNPPEIIPPEIVKRSSPTPAVSQKMVAKPRLTRIPSPFK